MLTQTHSKGSALGPETYYALKSIKSSGQVPSLNSLEKRNESTSLPIY